MLSSGTAQLKSQKSQSLGDLLKRRGHSNLRPNSLLQRAIYSEHYLSQLCSIMSNYTNLSALARDQSDAMAKCLAKFASQEKFHTTAKLAMTVCSELMASVGDHRNTQVKRLESKVLSGLSSYGDICKHLKFDLRNALVAQRRETARRKDLYKCTEKQSEKNVSNIMSIAEGEFEKAIEESSRLGSFSQDQLLKFEHRKARDLKETFKIFIQIEIAMHAKAIELYSQAYLHIDAIDPQSDVEVLRLGLKLKEIFPETRRKSKSKDKHTTKKQLESDSNNSCDFDSGEPGTWKTANNKGILKNIFDDFSESDSHIDSDQSQKKTKTKSKSNSTKRMSDKKNKKKY